MAEFKKEQFKTLADAAIKGEIIIDPLRLSQMSIKDILKHDVMLGLAKWAFGETKMNIDQLYKKATNRSLFMFQELGKYAPVVTMLRSLDEVPGEQLFIDIIISMMFVKDWIESDPCDLARSINTHGLEGVLNESI